MPAFKPKATKKIGKKTKNNVTVDSKHHEKMEEFKSSAGGFFRWYEKHAKIEVLLCHFFNGDKLWSFFYTLLSGCALTRYIYKFFHVRFFYEHSKPGSACAHIYCRSWYP